MASRIDLGRPRQGEESKTVRVIHVGLDAESLEALKRLEAAIGEGVRRGHTSIAVRRALLLADASATTRRR